MNDNKPALFVYSIRERDKGKSDIFTRIGAAWPYEKNGKKGFSVQLDALPLGNRLILAEAKDEPEAEGEGAQ